MFRLPDIGANRQSIFIVEFAVIEGMPQEIQRIQASTGLVFEVSNSYVDPETKSGKMVLTGWGNAFDAVTPGMQFTCNDRSVISVTECRYSVRGCVDDLHPGEMQVMNHLLGDTAHNKFVVPTTY